MMTAAHIRNRCMVGTIGRTLYELFYRKRPHISHMRTVGCAAYFKVKKPLSKLDTRGRQAVMVRYNDMNTQGYKLLDSKQKLW